MKITVIGVGKIREHFFVQAIEEYRKRLSRYCKLEIVEVADERTKEQASDAEIRLVKEREGERILKCIREDCYVIALAIDGTACDSMELSEMIARLGVEGRSHLCFVIGGSLGLSGAVCRRADFCLSFSRMTFPHPLMRVILLEQIYRSYRIINGEPYHK